MSTNVRRIGIATVILLLGLYAAFIIAGTRSAARRLDLDRRDLRELQQKLREIERVSDAPRVAALDLESPDQIVNRINAALITAGMKETVLANQTPSEPQRIGQSDFKLRRVEIKLNAATVTQIAAFCDALKDESTGSIVRDLQLFDPVRSDGRETWSSQMTLTQVIFSPKSEA